VKLEDIEKLEEVPQVLKSYFEKWEEVPQVLKSYCVDQLPTMFKDTLKKYTNYEDFGKINGKKILMLSAKATILNFSDANLYSSRRSIRFRKVVELLPQQGLHYPVKVLDLLHHGNESEFFYFITPSALNINDITRVPKQREDGWMEIQLWKFNSAHELENDSYSVNMKFTSQEGNMSGLIVCGLEFRPL
ncbi:kinase-like domain, phloem protein 2-like protein, partial [Tanacetum coccineum]